MKIFLIIILSIVCSQVYAKEEALGYYDINLDELILLDIDEKSIVVFHYKKRMEVCEKKDKNICFSSKYFSFSIPKKFGNLKVWNSGKTKYCLKRRFYNKEDKSTSLIVNFGYENTCEKIGYKLVFDTKFGLTYMEGRNFNGFPVKLVLIGKYGFGGKSISKN